VGRRGCVALEVDAPLSLPGVSSTEFEPGGLCLGVETPDPMSPAPAHPDLESLLAQRPRLRVLARRLLADEHGAEDVLQEAWLAALESPPRDVRALGAWMHQVVRRLALRRRRSEQRLREREQRAARPEGVFGEGEVAERLRTQREVLDAVLALDEPLRGTVHARYFEDRPPREIARLSGIPIDTVNDRLKRARRLLRADLKRRLGSEGPDSRRLGTWSLALLPLAEVPARTAALIQTSLTAGAGAVALGSTSTHLGELIVMKKMLAVALTLVAAGGLWWSRTERTPSTYSADRTSHESANGAIVGAESEPGLELEAGAAQSERRAAEAEPAAGAVADSHDWVVRGQVFLGTDTPAPQTQVRARLWSGIDTDLPPSLDVTLTSDAQGRLAWPLSAPEGTLTLRLNPRRDVVGYGDDAVLALGDGPPQGLIVRIFPQDISVVGIVRDEDGQVLVGAEVRASAEGSSVVTDGSGRYRVPGSSYRSGEYVFAEAVGMARKRAVVETPEPGGEVECDFTLRPAFGISGRVLDESGNPVAGARISTFFGGRNSVTSDVNGEFQLDHLDPGHDSHQVAVRAEGYVWHSETVETGTGEPVERDIVLERGAHVAGRVVDGRGRPVAAARVCMGFSTNAWNARWSWTGDDGVFEFPHAPRGEQILWIERAGLAAMKHVVSIPERGDLPGEVTIVLDAGRSVGGRVLDDQGRPVSDVGVYPRHEGDSLGLSIKTDAQGEFSLEHIPGQAVELSFYRPGWERVGVELAPGDVPDLRVVMNPSGKVAGRVIDAATGRPVEAFRIRLTYVVEEAGASRISLWSTWTRDGHGFSNPEGFWETSDMELPIGRDVAAQASAEGYAPSDFVRAAIGADPDPDDLVIALTRGLRLTGRVVEAGTGEPVAGARVSLEPDPTRNMELIGPSFPDPWTGRFTRTDSAGEFAFEHIAPQSVRLDITHEDYPQGCRSGPHEISEHGPEPNLLIELGGVGGIRGVVLDGSGAPRSGLELTLIGVEVSGVAGAFPRTQTTDGGGRFSFTGLPKGYYRIGEAIELLQGDPGIGRGLAVFLRDDSTVEVVLGEAGGAALQGTLVLPSVPPPTVELTLLRLPGQPEPGAPLTTSFFTVLASGGSFEVGGLPAGTYRMESRWFEDGEQFRGEALQFELEAGVDGQREFILTPR
jgi:RNA polymerase sigma factor (sigma-70 family)